MEEKTNIFDGIEAFHRYPLIDFDMLRYEQTAGIMISACAEHSMSLSNLKEFCNIAATNGEEKSLRLNDYDASIIKHFNESFLFTGYYVYELVNPETMAVFYVGHGYNDRICHHELYIKSESGHYNPELANVIKAIKAKSLNVEYRIRCSGLSKIEALKYEEEWIEFYGLESLCNIRTGIKHHNENNELRLSIAVAIDNFEDLCKRYITPGKKNVQTRIALLCFLLMAYKFNSIDGISISNRKLAETIGIGKNTGGKALKQLIKDGVIRASHKGKGDYSTKYSLNPDLFQYSVDGLELSKCINYENLLETLGNDAFRHCALNKSGLLIYVLLTRATGSFYTVKDISEALGIPYSTVARSLTKLCDAGIVELGVSGYAIVGKHSLDAAALKYGTRYIGQKHRQMHKTERFYYRMRWFNRIIPADFNGSVVDYVVGRLIDEYKRMVYKYHYSLYLERLIWLSEECLVK